MNFYNQYKDLFEVDSIQFLPTQKLKLDNSLFIDRPYIPTYTQEHSLNSKIKDLKKDYNQFENQIKQLQQLSHIPQRSQSRRKQYNPKPQSLQANPEPINNTLRNQHSYKKHHSTIFEQNQENRNQPATQKQNLKFRKSLPISSLLGSKQSNYKTQKYQRQKERPFDNQSHEMTQKQNQFQILKNSSIVGNQHQQQDQQSGEMSSEKKLLESLRKQNDINTAKLIKNQNLLKNKFYNQDANNVLQQSQINHVFNWKIEKQSELDKIPNLLSSNVPKYKIQTNSLESGEREQPINKNNRNFSIRNVPSSNEIKSVNQDKTIPRQKQFNMIKRGTNAQERRRLAKQNIDQRRQKLKIVLRAFY